MGKYNDWTRGEDEALLNIMGGVENARAVLRGERKLVVEEVVRQKVEEQVDYIVSLNDRDVPGEYRSILVNWRSYAGGYGYYGPVAWKVKAGFTLKQHALKLGPCYQGFSYLQQWKFEDKPTEDSIVFWIPRLVKDSTSKTADEQCKLLIQTGKTFNLPKHHCSGFGSASLLAGLILAYFKATGERVPLDRFWIRTKICFADGDRLGLGGFGEDGLYCYGWRDGDRDDGLGVFALGVEKLENLGT